MRVKLLLGVVALGACATKVQQMSVTTGPGTGAPSAVTSAFMQAVADSNLTQMGALWGTTKGPASTTNVPSNWMQRVSVIQAYLRGGTAKVVGENLVGSSTDRRVVSVELTRSGCTKTVPFTLIRLKDGAWLVNSVDLNAAGVPGRPCDTAPKSPSGTN